jgi:O-antigen/teichoic acid export membrane protein
MLFSVKKRLINDFYDRRFSKIFIGSIWAFGGQIISTIFAMLSSIIIARFYGADVLGIVAIVQSSLMLLIVLTVLGTNTSLLRLIPEHITKFSFTSAYKVFCTAQWVVVFSSLLFSVIIFFSAEIIAETIFSKPNLHFYFTAISVFLVTCSLGQVSMQAVRGLQLIKFFAFMQALPQIGNLILLISLSLLFFYPTIPVFSLLAGYSLMGIVGVFFVHYTFKHRVHNDDVIQLVTTCKLLRISLPMLLTHAMYFFIAQIGILILGIYVNEEEVGYYSTAVKLAGLTGFILNAVNAMVGPKFSELYNSGNINELFFVARQSAKLIFFTTTPILLILIFGGQFILKFIFGNAFVTAYPALVFLVVGQFVSSVSGSSGLFMNMTGNQNIFSIFVSFAAITNIVLCFILIPHFGIYGAGIASAISLSSWNIMALIYIFIKHQNTTGYLPIPSSFINQIRFRR